MIDPKKPLEIYHGISNSKHPATLVAVKDKKIWVSWGDPMTAHAFNFDGDGYGFIHTKLRNVAPKKIKKTMYTNIYFCQITALSSKYIRGELYETKEEAEKAKYDHCVATVPVTFEVTED